MADAGAFSRRSYLNPDEDFVLHGKSTSYWEKRGYLTNSELTGTTARLSQHSIYNPENYRDFKRSKCYARSMTDLANNLEVLSGEVDQTLVRGVTFKDEQIDKEIQNELEFQRALRENIKPSQFSQPTQNETLRTELTEDELLDLYEKRVGEIDSLSGKVTSPRDSQWYVNPNHIKGTSEAPTLQSISSSYRYGNKSKDKHSDKDKIAFEYFPVTFGSSYEMCALDYPASASMNASAPPSMRASRSKSASRLGRSYTFRTPDRNFNEKQDVEKLYLISKEAPTIGSSSVYLTSPHQLVLGKLRLERLKLEESKLLEVKRLEELERIRGPRPKWYMSKGPDFHYESKKNTELVKSVSDYQDMLDYREDLLRSSYENLKKYTRRPMAV